MDFAGGFAVEFASRVVVDELGDALDIALAQTRQMTVSREAPEEDVVFLVFSSLVRGVGIRVEDPEEVVVSAVGYDAFESRDIAHFPTVVEGD